MAPLPMLDRDRIKVKRAGGEAIEDQHKNLLRTLFQAIGHAYEVLTKYGKSWKATKFFLSAQYKRDITVTRHELTIAGGCAIPIGICLHVCKSANMKETCNIYSRLCDVIVMKYICTVKTLSLGIDMETNVTLLQRTWVVFCFAVRSYCSFTRLWRKCVV